MTLDGANTRIILDRLGDEIEEAARIAGPHRAGFKVERDARKVTVSRSFRVEVSVSGEKERVEAMLVTSDDRRPETRDYPIPRDNSEFRTLAKELIQPLMGGS
jgi:hypothetical protein